MGHFRNMENMLAYRLQQYFALQDKQGKGAIRPTLMHNPFCAGVSRSTRQKLIVLLALCPEFAPTLIERCLKKHLESGGDLPAFGGVRGTQHRGIIPTGETALFLLGAADLDSRLRVRKYFDPETRLVSDNFIELHPPPAGEPSLAGRLVPHLDILQRLISGKVDLPHLLPQLPRPTPRNQPDLGRPSPARAQPPRDRLPQKLPRPPRTTRR